MGTPHNQRRLTGFLPTVIDGLSSVLFVGSGLGLFASARGADPLLAVWVAFLSGAGLAIVLAAFHHQSGQLRKGISFAIPALILIQQEAVEPRCTYRSLLCMAIFSMVVCIPLAMVMGRKMSIRTKAPVRAWTGRSPLFDAEIDHPALVSRRG